VWEMNISYEVFVDKPLGKGLRDISAGGIKY
jgi:hypothetical protein